ncbi:MAG: hypothetical protein KJ645_07890, partial [Planctomycetes bacterium]|nr:hypothetical protein [Planctomycetota bacterium]
DLRLEGGDQKIVVSDGQNRGEWINGKPTDRDVTADLVQRKRLTMIHAFFLEEEVKDVTLAEVERLEDRPCACLDKRCGEETWRIWIDLSEYRIRKIGLLMPSAEQASGLSGSLAVDWIFDDFQWVESRLVPFTYQTFLNGTLFQEGRILRFALNQGFTTDDFKWNP